jgi:hypothetical protein
MSRAAVRSCARVRAHICPWGKPAIWIDCRQEGGTARCQVIRGRLVIVGVQATSEGSTASFEVCRQPHAVQPASAPLPFHNSYPIPSGHNVKPDSQLLVSHLSFLLSFLWFLLLLTALYIWLCENSFYFSYGLPPLDWAAGTFILYLDLGAAKHTGPWWVTPPLNCSSYSYTARKTSLSVTKELNPNMWSSDMRGTLSHYFVYLCSPNLIFWRAFGQNKPQQLGNVLCSYQ